MNEFIATFYTHAGAIVGKRDLAQRGIAAKMMPVPRSLSSSCGTCVRYEADSLCEDAFAKDLEAIYEASEKGYVRRVERS